MKLASVRDPAPRIVAMVGESQVGKSSLVNAIVGENLLPTAGAGRPRSQAVCECLLDQLPVAEDSLWNTTVQWLSTDELADISTPPLETARVSPRTRLFQEGLGATHAHTAATAREILQVEAEVPRRLAMGRDVAWLRLGVACTGAEAQRQLDPLTGGWAAALASSVRVAVAGAAKHRYAIVDLPGVGGYRDVGEEATLQWLKEHASRISAVVCVIGKNGFGERLSSRLLEHWTRDDLRARLHVVTTHADELVSDPNSSVERGAAASARRGRALEQVARLVDVFPIDDELSSRIYCIDPRRPGRWVAPVAFDGELPRLREAIGSAREAIGSARVGVCRG